ncbi:MAG: pyridoxamine 5'-phosphate oxidase family protein [Boseongicola sp. SB0664_bin_43]|uniref:Pyridoxamine 5'-phosphate oxidase family protein n=1 Tax=Boseongicola sp. SB0664_bin_43 TaxID=2604844 RepID=A0A6B0XZJ6_9RHOB|nr:pyridoxamine 5'-phosphate oxidase family protein [Boseongicola sp. SB0664_bin_43]
MLDAEAQRIIREFPLGVVATVTPDGEPAASPKGTFLALGGDAIAYGDIRSPGTRRNLSRAPAAEVVFVDPFRRKGVRVFGRATIIGRGDPSFAGLYPMWEEAWSELASRISHLVRIGAERVLHLATPPYDDGATEDEMIALYKSRFAELYS